MSRCTSSWAVESLIFDLSDIPTPRTLIIQAIETQKANNITTGNLYGGSGASLKADNAVLGVEVLAVHLDQPQTKHLKYNGREQYSAPHKLFPNAGLIKKGSQNAAKRDH